MTFTFNVKGGHELQQIESPNNENHSSTSSGDTKTLAHRRDSSKISAAETIQRTKKAKTERDRFQSLYLDTQSLHLDDAQSQHLGALTTSPEHSESELETLSQRPRRRSDSVAAGFPMPQILREYSVDAGNGRRTRRSSVVFNFSSQSSGRKTISSIHRQDSSGAPAVSIEDALAFPKLIMDPLHPFGKAIGTGTFGTVHRAPLEQGGTCAIKQFHARHGEQGWDEFYLHEDLRILIGQHENIMGYLGSATVGENNIVLAFEWVGGETVGRLCKDAHVRLSGEERLKLGQYVISGAIKGLAALENVGYAHNDIKPDNIFFDRETKVTKLIDLGNASVHNRSRQAGNAMYSGPERVMAFPMEKPAHASPEAWAKVEERVGQEYRAMQLSEREKDLEKIRETDSEATPGRLSADLEQWSRLREEKYPHRKEPVTRKTDSFGIGQVLHELVEGHTFLMVNQKDYPNLLNLTFGIIAKAADFEKRGQVFLESDQQDALKRNSGYYDFVNKAMHPDPGQRLSPSELLKHPFLSEALSSPAEIDAILKKL
jgi:serine/threonine protein kinase